jgi:hypothetical protein
MMTGYVTSEWHTEDLNMMSTQALYCFSIQARVVRFILLFNLTTALPINTIQEKDHGYFDAFLEYGIKHAATVGTGCGLRGL